ncbi:MAG: hypothetical protein ACRD0P_14405 [Stackebrandtia sp.]
METDLGPHIVVVESQTAVDPTRERSWPYYIAYLGNKFECPVTLLVVTASRETAEWASKPMTIGPDGWATLTLRPLVAGPDNTPIIDDHEVAGRDVMMAVLSALTHREQPCGTVILETLARALGDIDTVEAVSLAEFTEVGLANSPAANLWRNLMTTMNLPYKSVLHERFNEEGRAQQAAASVLNVLRVRGLEVQPELEARVKAIDNVAELEALHSRAITVGSTDDLFD